MEVAAAMAAVQAAAATGAEVAAATAAPGAAVDIAADRDSAEGAATVGQEEVVTAGRARVRVAAALLRPGHRLALDARAALEVLDGLVASVASEVLDGLEALAELAVQAGPAALGV